MKLASGVEGRAAPVSTSTLDVEAVRRQFPILATRPHGRPLVYLDNAATTQKPQVVIDAIVRYYTAENANIHRGVHWLSEQATARYEGARRTVADFIGAAEPAEIVFTRGTTEAINLVAHGYGREQLGEGDEILVTAMEHHSNIVPWQMLCEKTGARLRVAPIDDRGQVILDEYEKLLGPRTRIVSMVHISNALGTVNPVAEMIRLARRHDCVVLVDGAQAVAHETVDVQALDCDFYAFSGHKLYGPTGIGVLYGKRAILDAMAPFQGGGDMIASVTWEKTKYNRVPQRFEAGTPNIAGTVGLAAAIDWLRGVGVERIAAHEAVVVAYAAELVGELAGVRLIGTAERRAGVVSFVLDGIHPHDIGTVLDGEGIAVRAGHHCAQPVMERFGIPATVRASFAVYNTRAEADALMRGLARVKELLG